MSRKGNCYDNAFIESFWSTLKYELVYRQRFATRDEAPTAIFDYIEAFTTAPASLDPRLPEPPRLRIQPQPKSPLTQLSCTIRGKPTLTLMSLCLRQPHRH